MISFGREAAFWNKKNLHLTPTELLVFKELYWNGWIPRPEQRGKAETLRVKISNIRKKLADAGADLEIKSKFQKGYLMKV